jgi:hypothetical protein
MLHSCYRHITLEDDKSVCMVCGRVDPPRPRMLEENMTAAEMMRCMTDSRFPGQELPPVSEEMRKMIDDAPY